MCIRVVIPMAATYKLKGNLGDPVVKIRLEQDERVQTFPLFAIKRDVNIYRLSSNGLVFLITDKNITCLGYSLSDEQRSILPLTTTLKTFCRRIGVNY